MQLATELAEEMQHHDLTAGSRATYLSSQEAFLHVLRGVRGKEEVLDRPITEAELCVCYVALLRQRSVFSMASIMSAVARLHEDLGFGELPRGRKFKKVCKAAKKWLSAADNPTPKHAITLKELATIAMYTDTSSYENLCFVTALILAFWGLLRGSEHCDGALEWRDVKSEAWGLAVTIRKAKNHDAPQTIYLAKRKDGLCPAQWFERLRQATPLAHRHGAIFRVEPHGKLVTYQSFNKKLKQAAQRFFEGEARNMASHSARRGGYTALRNAGVSEEYLQLHGRWKGMSFRAYLDKLSAVTRITPTLLHAMMTGAQDAATMKLARDEAEASILLQNGVRGGPHVVADVRRSLWE